MVVDSWEHADSTPFDDHAIERLAQYYYPTGWDEGFFLSVLSMRYMEKLFQENGFDFDFWKPRCFFGTSFNEDYFSEDFLADYVNSAGDLFFSTCKALKWETLWFNLNREHDEFLDFDPGEIPLEVMQSYLKSIDLSPEEINMATNDMGFLYDTLGYDENNGAIFFWNKKVSVYNCLPKDKKTWLSEQYSPKIYRIDQLLNRIKYPLTTSWSESISNTYNGIKYFAFNMGFNGESDIYFDALDPNWVVCMFILDAAMDDVFHLLDMAFPSAA